MKNKKLLTQSFTLLLGLMLVLSACASGGNGGAQELADSSWELISMPGYDDLGDVQVTLNFDSEGAIGGNGGCNSFGGSYETFAAEATIKFSEIFSTEMFCEDGNASEIEFAFFQALADAQSYSQTFEFLRIKGSSGTLEFGVAP